MCLCCSCSSESTLAIFSRPLIRYRDGSCNNENRMYKNPINKGYSGIVAGKSHTDAGENDEERMGMKDEKGRYKKQKLQGKYFSSVHQTQLRLGRFH